MENKLYVHYGCGLSAPVEWVNFDASPTLRIQRTPLVGFLLKNKLNCNFPDNVKFGDIVKGLPVKDNSCDGIYCSHVLEHLSLNDFRAALKNTYRHLKPGGIFRCVVPDLEVYTREYIHALDTKAPTPAIDFIKTVLLGAEDKPKNISALVKNFLGNSHHLWMWDHPSLNVELQRAGFVGMRTCVFNDCQDKMFAAVEDRIRFMNAVAIECTK